MGITLIVRGKQRLQKLVHFWGQLQFHLPVYFVAEEIAVGVFDGDAVFFFKPRSLFRQEAPDLVFFDPFHELPVFIVGDFRFIHEKVAYRYRFVIKHLVCGIKTTCAENKTASRNIGHPERCLDIGRLAAWNPDQFPVPRIAAASQKHAGRQDRGQVSHTGQTHYSFHRN